MSTSTEVSLPSCPNCGTRVSDLSTALTEAHNRIRDLEAQVRLLNSKAAAAVDRLADYEDEIRYLRTHHERNPPSHNGYASPPLEEHVRPQTANAALHPPQAQSRIASLSSFWSSRKSSANPGLSRVGTDTSSITPVPPTPSSTSLNISNQTQTAFPSNPNPAPLHSNISQPQTNIDPDPDHTAPPTRDLSAALESERHLRLQAEQTLSQTQSELEDLTAHLFGEANEMVAAERRARSKLEDRVRLLEKRDGEKRRRLERLEAAMVRIERVRGLVGHQ